MTERRFPRSPKVSARPFNGGQNPFSDANTPTTEAHPSSNPFGSNSASNAPTVPVGVYDKVFPHRARLVFWLGSLGAGFALVTILWAGSLVLFANWRQSMFMCLPASIASLTFAIPACIFGRGDLRAMKAGAMDETGWSRTRLGWWLGVGGLIFGTLPTLLAIASVFMAWM